MLNNPISITKGDEVNFEFLVKNSSDQVFNLTNYKSIFQLEYNNTYYVNINSVSSPSNFSIDAVNGIVNVSFEDSDTSNLESHVYTLYLKIQHLTTGVIYIVYKKYFEVKETDAYYLGLMDSMPIYFIITGTPPENVYKVNKAGTRYILSGGTYYTEEDAIADAEWFYNADDWYPLYHWTKSSNKDTLAKYLFDHSAEW
jgi:hypothetical protein